VDGLTAVSLFAGIGGIDLALERAGVSVKAVVEINPDCRGVLRRHFPGTAIFNDVTEVTGGQLRAAGFVPGRGILGAGWPCQGNSVAGRGQGMADPRSGLWRHVVRLLAETRPRWFLGENVPGLLSVSDGRDFGRVIADLDELGYGVAWRILDAQHFGVPQRRRRVFLAGCLGDGIAPVEVLFEPESGGGDLAAGGEPRPGSAGASRGGAVSALQGGGRRGYRVDAEGAAGGHLIASTLRSHPRPGSNSNGAVVPVALRGRDEGSNIELGEPGDPAFTVRTPGGGSSYPMVAMAFSPKNSATAAASLGYGERSPTLQANKEMGVHTRTAVRRLTPLECERLQGFPDGWTAGQSDSVRYRELGNSVAVPVVEWITRRIVAASPVAATLEEAS
jgi:DNA (cytosine-5)-methyltransferase 1